MQYHVGPGESAWSFSWPDGVKGELNQALVSLDLVLHILVVFIDCCLGFLCCHLVVVMFGFASTSQVIGYEDCFLAAVKRLAGTIVSIMTYSVGGKSTPDLCFASPVEIPE